MSSQKDSLVPGRAKLKHTRTSFTPHINILAYLTHLLLFSSDTDKMNAWQLGVWEGLAVETRRICVTDVASDKEGGYDETRMGALLEIWTVSGHWVIDW